MSFLRHLTEKPWVASEAGWPGEHARGVSPARRLAPSVALNFFLGVASILFFLLVISYSERMAFEDWRPAPPLSLLWQNTILLVLASITMEWARYAAAYHLMDRTKLGMLSAGVFTAAFVAGQIIAWRELSATPVFSATNPAIAFFYLITGLHVVHILGGMVAWGVVLDRLWRGADSAAVLQSVRLCARYWHFLLIVWLLLFGLLFSGNDNLKILLTICGIR
jgi:cytochrome c oxidase subunit III